MTDTKRTAILASDDGGQRRYRHKKRGSVVVEIGRGRLQAEGWMKPNPGGVLRF